MKTTPSIVINGETVWLYRVTERLKDLALPEWERELYLFLNDWFSDSTFISAQTSGSTGEPKTIELPKSVMRKSAERTIGYFGLQPTARLLLSLPCRYIAGKMMVVRAIIGQMSLTAVDPATGFGFLSHETYDFGALVPNQVFKILEQTSGQQWLQNIRNLLIGGSAISTELEMQISTLDSRVVSTYGMTETASHIAVRELSGQLRSEYYSCLPGISVSLQGNGCLQIHLPEFSEPLKTNDVAELHSKNEFRILGRIDSVIVSGGIKYSPEVIEKKLEKLIIQPYVISSVPDQKLGEKIVLVIEGNPMEPRLLEEAISTILHAYERPRTILFLEHFPLTESGKIRRNEIKQRLRSYSQLNDF